MKAVLCLVIFAGSAYLGCSFGKKYRQKERFFEELVVFCGEAKSRIGFFRSKLSELLQTSEKTLSTDLGKICGQIGRNVQAGNVPAVTVKTFCGLGYLTDAQKDVLCGFFSMLGSSDAKSQSEQICGYEKIFESYLQAARGDNKTKGRLCPKLGVFLGLFAVILFL